MIIPENYTDEYLDTLSPLQRTAVMLGFDQPFDEVSEFELHKFVKEQRENRDYDPSKVIHIWNAFEMFGMPVAEAEQTQLARLMFSVDTYHLHDRGDGRYFIIRHTKIDGNSGIGVHKLDPTIPEQGHMMHDLVSMIQSQWDTNE